MELPLAFQGAQFFKALLLGIIYGVHYDLLRGLRGKGRWRTFFVDAYYALTCLIGNFLLALYVGKGEFRIFMLCAIVLGMAAWFLTLSGFARRGFDLIWQIFLWPLRLLRRICKKILEKTKKIIKNIFSFAKKRVIIKNKENSSEGQYYAPVQVITHYQVHNFGRDDLCDRDDRQPSAEDR